jgi:hypothetical protein
MKAIRTSYVGPTNTRGSRIIASDADGNKVSIGYPHQLSSDEAHELAAYRLMEKMGWPNRLVGGGFGAENFWVMVPREDRTEPPAYLAVLEGLPALRPVKKWQA